MKKLLVLELNELNFEFVEHYARIGALPAIRRLRVGAFSPMNAGNAVAGAAFFVPDPWTKVSAF